MKSLATERTTIAVAAAEAAAEIIFWIEGIWVFGNMVLLVLGFWGFFFLFFWENVFGSGINGLFERALIGILKWGLIWV